MGILGKLFKPDVAELSRKNDLKGLTAALNHSDLMIRWQAVQALNGKRPMMWSSVVAQLLIQPGSVEILRTFLTTEKKYLADRDIVLLLWQAEQEWPDVVRPFLRQLTDGLIEVLRDRDERERKVDRLRSFAARLLGAGGDQRAVPALIEELKGSGQRIPDVSAEALGTIGDLRALEPLIARFEWHLELVRRGNQFEHEAAKALGHMRDTRAAQALVKGLSDLVVLRRTGGDVIRGALHDLGELAADPLLELLGHAEPEVRYQATETLGLIGSPKAVEPLEQLLGDDAAGALFRCDDPSVGGRAAYSLQRIGEPARAALQRAAQDGPENVRQRAEQALKALKAGASPGQN